MYSILILAVNFKSTLREVQRRKVSAPFHAVHTRNLCGPMRPQIHMPRQRKVRSPGCSGPSPCAISTIALRSEMKARRSRRLRWQSVPTHSVGVVLVAFDGRCSVGTENGNLPLVRQCVSIKIRVSTVAFKSPCDFPCYTNLVNLFALESRTQRMPRSTCIQVCPLCRKRTNHY